MGKDFVDALFPRKTQILAAEAVAVLTSLILSPDLSRPGPSVGDIRGRGCGPPVCVHTLGPDGGLVFSV
eukprot:841598-Heterocapsa_arctica.AAC.1